MKSKTYMVRCLAAAALWAAFGGCLTAGVENPTFPIFGAGSGQIFRFAVAGDIPPGPCRAMLSFRNTRNEPIGPSREVNLGPHQAAFLDLNPRAMGVPLGQRIHFRPVLTHFADSGPCNRSFDLFEPNSGRTIGWVPPPEPDFAAVPPPEPDFPPMGLAAGQSLFFAVVRSTEPQGDIPPGPCDAMLMVFGPEGNVLASMPTGALMPGHAALLRLNASSLGLTFGQRLELQPSIMPAMLDSFTPGSIDGCIMSVQLVDNSSQWTTTMMTQ